jgi:ComB9 competence protein
MKKIILILLFFTQFVYSFEDVNENTNTNIQENELENNLSTIANIFTPIDVNSVQKAYLKNNLDNAIIVYKYNPDKLMRIRTRILNETTIILPQGEEPIKHTNGNPGAFKINFVKKNNPRFNIYNTFTITPGLVGTDTTITIFGKTGRIYNFYLYSVGVDSDKIPNTAVYVTQDGKIPKNQNFDDFDEKNQQIVKLQEEVLKYKEKLNLIEEKKQKNLKDFNIATIQLDYNFKKEFQLEAVFNDEEFTYFKFKKDFKIPKIYTEDTLQDRTNMNFIVFENILKVHKLSKKWFIELAGRYIEIVKKGSFSMEYSHKKIYVDMTKTHFELTAYSGDKSLTPEIIFRDEEFTYFKFDISNGFKKFPAIYRVIDGYDNPSNFEIIGDYMVVKSLSHKYTLRLGERHLCIRDNNND